MAKKKLTDAKRQSLEIVRDKGKVSPGWFARLRWPNSPSWTTPGRCGPKGSTVGVGIRQRAGTELWTLERAGLLLAAFDIPTMFSISQKGLDALRDGEYEVEDG
jgi:hypothetical protein